MNLYIQRLFLYGLAVIGFLLTSCSRILPCNLSSGLTVLEDKPEPEFLVGKYVPDSKTIEWFKTYKDMKHPSMNIKLNGVYEIKDIPAGILDLDAFYYEDKTKKIDVRGKWKAVTHEKATFFSVNVDFNKDQINAEDYGTSWQIFSKGEKAVIIIPVGDPDECRAVRFIKE
ncbi:hypothetical protein [Sinomicrobium pectinilyticum]|nr:hypothetical protein [Sinomicrobium pectinilyticum]